MSSIVKSSKSLVDKVKALASVGAIKGKLQSAKAKLSKDGELEKSSECSQTGSGRNDALRRFLIKKMGHFKYGLYSEDLISEEIREVQVAIKRLPPEVYDARAFRIARAIYLDAKKIYLPKQEWVTYEDDLQNRYLTPYIEEVKYEQQEKYNYNMMEM